MREIDLLNWPRREHFLKFREFNHPHFNLCANVDITALQPALKEGGVSFTIGVVYLVARCANSIPEFRTRMRGEVLVEHEVVHPATTIMAPGDLFTFCDFEYRPDFHQFKRLAAGAVAAALLHPSLENIPGKDDMLYTSTIPWVSFTSFTHPMQQHPSDSIPRFAWGKYFVEGDRLKMPLSVQGHHALMDGVHMGWFYERMQDLLDHPHGWLNGA